jgi:hypothetical protein
MVQKNKSGLQLAKKFFHQETYKVPCDIQSPRFREPEFASIKKILKPRNQDCH